MRFVGVARGLLFALCITLVLPGAAAVAQEKSEAGTRQYNAAVALQNKGEFELAADEWNKFVTDFPKDARRDAGYHYLGICQLKANKVDAAQQSFETFIKTFPKSELLESTYLYLGIAQFTTAQQGKAEKYDAADDAFAALLKKFPKGKYAAQALYYRGECAYAKDNKKDAAKFYAQLVERHPDDRLASEALYALGVAQEEAEEHAAAAKSFDKFLEKYPDHALNTEVVMWRGQCDFAVGRFDEAAKRFAAAAAKEGFAQADYATRQYAAALAKQKKYAEAAKVDAGLLEKFPQSRYAAEARLAGGWTSYQAGDYAAARTLLSPLLNGDDAKALEAKHWIARAWLKEGKPAEAIKVVDDAKATQAKGDIATLLAMDRADALYELPDRRKESVAVYAAVAEKHPEAADAPQAGYMAAFAALNVGQFDDARKYAVAFLKNRGDHELAADVKAIAAEAALQLKDYAAAEKRFAELVEKHASHADTETWKVRLGLTLFLQKKYKETVVALAPVVKQLRNPETVAEAQFLVGSSQAEQHEYDKAIKSLEASLAASGKWQKADDVLLILAHAYYQAKNADKAKATLAKLIVDHSQSRLLDQAHYRLGEYASAAEDWKTAAAEYQKVLESWPQSTLAPFALYGLGWAKFNTQDYAGAEKTLDTLIEKYAEHRLAVQGRFPRGMARQQSGKFGPAADDLKAFLGSEATATEKADAQYVLALCYVGQKQADEAVKTLEQLLAAGPKLAVAEKANYELGWALKSLDQDDKAAAAFAKVVELNSDGPLAAECLYHLGENAYKKNDLKKAVESYAKAAEKADKGDLGEKATHKLGWTHFRQDDFAAAEKAFADQRQRWPAGTLAPDATFMLAECQFKQQKYKEAAASYEAVTASSIKEADVLTLLHGAQAEAQLEKWDKSLKLLRTLLEKHPDAQLVPEALYEEGAALKAQGKPAEAVKRWEQVIAKTGREVAARAQFMIGEVQFEEKNHTEAIKSFNRVAAGYSYPKWQADALYEAGRCFEVLNKSVQAQKQYEELIERFSTSDKAPLAKERLQALKKG